MSIHPRSTAGGDRRYDVRLRTPSGDLYSRTFRTRKEAERFEDTERSDRSRGTWIDPRQADTRFAEVAAEWLESVPGKKESTISRDISTLNNHLLPALGPVPIGAISPADVQKLVTRWAKTLSPRTVQRQYAVLRAVFNLAVDTDRIGRSPCRKIKLPKQRPVEHRLATPVELHRLVGEMPPGCAAMVYVSAILGLRWGECAGLRVKDIDFLTGTVNVAIQRTRGLNGRMVVTGPKWDSDRTIAAPPALLELLTEHLRRRGITGADADAPVFVGPHGEPLNYSNWRRRVWEPACCQAELSDLKFQSLRTLNATAMVALAVDVKTAQTRAGHKQAKTTLDIYAQATTVGDRDAATKLGGFFLAPATSAPPRAMEPDLACDGCAMESDTAGVALERTPFDQGFSGGAGKNRTCDLSIISAAL